MSDVPFHTTRMGQQFFLSTLPALVRELTRLNDNMERLVAAADRNARNSTMPSASGERESAR